MEGLRRLLSSHHVARSHQLHSPVAPFTGKAIGTRIGLSPILRAGIGMTDAALEVFPEAAVLHLGLFRDKTTLQAIE